MMNKYAHHLSVAFVVSLEKFPKSATKNPSPKFVFQSEQGGGVFYGGVCRRTEYVKELLMDRNSIY